MSDSMSNISSSKSSSKVGLGSIVFIICSLTFAVLLTASLFRKVFSGTEISFASFLDWLSVANSFHFSINIQDFFIYGDWGLFEFLRNFLNLFTQAFGLIVFLATNLINMLLYVLQFIQFLFA